jgi:hypothetical protein
MMRVLNSGWDAIGDWPVQSTNGAGYFTTDSNTQYVGGMPVGLNLNGATANEGYVCGGNAEQCIVSAISVNGGDGAATGAANGNNMIGLLFNNSIIDIREGAGNTTETAIIWAFPSIVPTPCYVELWRGTAGSTDLPTYRDTVDYASPFATGDAWANGDLLYIEENASAAINGILTRTASATNNAAVGRVMGGSASPAVVADDTETMIAMFWQGNPPGNVVVTS